MNNPVPVINPIVQKYSKEGDHVLNMTEPFRLLKHPLDLNASLERYIVISLTYQSLSELGLWSQVNTGYQSWRRLPLLLKAWSIISPRKSRRGQSTS